MRDEEPIFLYSWGQNYLQAFFKLNLKNLLYFCGLSLKLFFILNNSENTLCHSIRTLMIDFQNWVNGFTKRVNSWYILNSLATISDSLASLGKP